MVDASGAVKEEVSSEITPAGLLAARDTQVLPPIPCAGKGADDLMAECQAAVDAALPEWQKSK